MDTKSVDCLIIANGALGLFLANELCQREPVNRVLGTYVVLRSA